MTASFLTAVSLLLSVLATAHVLLSKREVRAAIGWTAVVWLVPLLGVLLYLLLGVNRIRRRAEQRRRERLHAPALWERESEEVPLEALDPQAPARFASHARLGYRLTRMPLTAGNRLLPLVNGDEAYPAMIAAIDAAERSVALCTYIFQWDEVGRAFADALERAVARGVRVCVLLDAVGSLLNGRHLRRRGIAARHFNIPTPLHAAFLNLRTHRKILVVDGKLGFTGGMNIRDLHQAAGRKPLSSQDMMFRLDGPVLGQLLEVFHEDWQFAGGPQLTGEAWFPPETLAEQRGSAIMRAMPDGPDMDFSSAGWSLESVLSVARRKVRITTPYFLPDLGLISALAQAALRGVEVDILVPGASNLPFIRWASQAQFDALLAYGCRLHLTPPPFDHKKIVVVDDYWSLIGSSNWDARSFRLNFELNTEIFDTAVAKRLDALLAERIRVSTPITYEAFMARSTALRLRDRAAWLMSPYL